MVWFKTKTLPIRTRRLQDTMIWKTKKYRINFLTKINITFIGHETTHTHSEWSLLSLKKRWFTALLDKDHIQPCNREATWSNTDIGNRKIFIKYWTTSVWRNRRKQSRRSYKKTRKFKIPRIEKIQNYCLNYSTSTCKYIAKQLDRILKGVSPIGSWFTTGQVILIPKN